MKFKEIMEKTIPDSIVFKKYWDGKDEKSFCMRGIIDNQEIHSPIDLIAEYYQSYPASPIYKEKVMRPFLLEWYENLVDTLNIYDKSEEVLPHYQYNDKAKKILELLQNRDGVTKLELSEQLGESQRSVQTDLRSIDSSLYRNSDTGQNNTLTIGGNSIKTKIIETRDENRIKRYKTQNSVHPIVLFSSVMEVGVLLKALAHLKYGNDQSEIAEYEGANIWLQLTDYCKDRIRLIFANQDSILLDFIGRIERNVKERKLIEFLTERDLEQSYGNVFERLTIAVKDRRRCDLTLEINNEEIEYKDVIIEFSPPQKNSILKNGYIAKSSNGLIKSPVFSDNQVSRLDLLI